MPKNKKYKYLVADKHEPTQHWYCKNEKEVIDVAQEYYEYLFEDEIEGEFKDDPCYPVTFEMAKDFLECNDRPVTNL